MYTFKYSYGSQNSDKDTRFLHYSFCFNKTKKQTVSALRLFL